MAAAEQNHNSSELMLTDGAVAQVKTLLARNGREGEGLRVSVAGGGCSGFSYQLSFDKEAKPDDVVLERGGI